MGLGRNAAMSLTHFISRGGALFEESEPANTSTTSVPFRDQPIMEFLPVVDTNLQHEAQVASPALCNRWVCQPTFASTCFVLVDIVRHGYPKEMDEIVSAVPRNL